MGVAYREMGSFDRALECYDKALEMNPGSAVAWNNLGVLLSRTGNLKRALHCLNKSLECDPNLEEALQERERVIGRMGSVSHEVPAEPPAQTTGTKPTGPSPDDSKSM
jgi:tetratricopeptide (TPR) repeat protein